MAGLSERVAAIAWKDALEFLRDRRSLVLMAVSAFLFPLLGVLVTGLVSQQHVAAAVVVCDNSSLARGFAEALARGLEGLGWVNVSLLVSGRCHAVPGAAVTVAVPRGFGANATSIDKPVVVLLYKLVGSAAADTLESVVKSTVSEFSRRLAEERVASLAKLAGMKLDPRVVLEPVHLVSATVTVGGAAAPREVAERAQAARFLAFAVFFLLNPAALAVADAVVRERESGTGELVAVTPVSGVEFVLGKAIGSLAALAVTGGLDMAAVAAYTWLVGGVTPGLALFHVAATVLAVFATVSLTLLATMLVPGQRAANLVTSLVTGTAVMVFFAALFVDIGSLPLWIKALLYTIPYTYIVEAIRLYALGRIYAAMLHAAAVLGVSLAALLAAARLYAPWRMVKTGG